MRVLVLGAYGMLGHQLLSGLQNDLDMYGTCRSVSNGYFSNKNVHIVPGVDAERLDTVERAISSIGPRVVINCIGIVKQKKEARDPIKSIYINALFPHLLNGICSKNDARLIHFSTDCVFSGKKGRYSFSDASDAEDLYGRTKSLGELTSERSLTIRSSIIGPELGTRNGLLEWFVGQRGKAVSGYKNAIYSGLTTLEMTKVVSMMIDEHPDIHGIWQVASSPISKYELLSMINERMGLGITIEPEYSIKCDRSLDGSEFSKATGYQPPSWSEMINDLAKDMGTERRRA